MVLRGWGARVCARSKSRTRAREPGGGSRPGLLSLGHHHCLPPLSLAARRSIRLPRTCRAPLCLICPQVVWWRWRWWRRRAAHHSLALALAVSLSLDLSLDLSLSRPLSRPLSPSLHCVCRCHCCVPLPPWPCLHRHRRSFGRCVHSGHTFRALATVTFSSTMLLGTSTRPRFLLMVLWT